MATLRHTSYIIACVATSLDQHAKNLIHCVAGVKRNKCVTSHKFRTCRRPFHDTCEINDQSEKTAFEHSNAYCIKLYKVYKKKATLNIQEYSLCFTVEKTLSHWDLRTIVIVFYRHNYLNKVGCVNQMYIEVYNSEYS